MRRSPPGGDRFFRHQREEREPGRFAPSEEMREPEVQSLMNNETQGQTEQDYAATPDLQRESEEMYNRDSLNPRCDEAPKNGPGNEDVSKDVSQLSIKSPQAPNPRVLGMGELATAYVPWQVYTRIMAPGEAHPVGTIFPELARTPPLYKKS